MNSLRYPNEDIARKHCYQTTDDHFAQANASLSGGGAAHARDESWGFA